MKTYIGTTRQIYKEFIDDNKKGQYDLEKTYKCEIKDLKGDKTEAQRSRYWVMVREVAKLVKESPWYIHNRNLRDLGIIEKDEKGEEMYMLLDKDYNFERDYSHHLKDTQTYIKMQDGSIKRLFLVLKDSEDFTTDEYSQLIDMCISNIQQDGLDNEIDTNYMRV